MVHLNSKTTSSQTLAKQEDSLDSSVYIPYASRPILASEITYQRLSRMGRVPSSTSVSTNSPRNESSDEKSMMSAPVNSSTSLMSTSSRSLSEPRRRLAPNESLSAVAMANQKSSTHLAPSGKCGDNISSTMFISSSVAPRATIASPRSGSTTPTTPRPGEDDDAR